MPKIEIHPNACAHITKASRKALRSVRKYEPDPSQAPLFPSDIIPAHEIEEANFTDSIGSLISGAHTQVGRTFFVGEEQYVLEGEGYQNVKSITETLLKNHSVRSSVSEDFIEDAIIQWIKSIKTNLLHEEIVSFIISKIEKNIKHLTIWVPVQDLYIPRDIKMGNVTLRKITEHLFDAIIGTIVNKLKSSSKNPDFHDKFIANLKKDIIGHTVSEYSSVSEEKHAAKLAIVEAEKSLLCLHSLSAPNIIPDLVSYISAKGVTPYSSHNYIYIVPNKDVGTSQNITPVPWIWNIDEKFLSTFERELRHLDEIIGTPKTSFHSQLLSSLEMYGKSARLREHEDKITFIFSSLESLLLRDQTEPIQNSFSERLAFYISNEPSERKKISEVAKSAYAARSRYIHHGLPSSDKTIVQQFLIYIRRLFILLIQDKDKYSDKAHLISELENRKWR